MLRKIVFWILIAIIGLAVHAQEKPAEPVPITATLDADDLLSVRLYKAIVDLANEECQKLSSVARTRTAFLDLKEAIEKKHPGYTLQPQLLALVPIRSARPAPEKPE